jgi:hypothetical protein
MNLCYDSFSKYDWLSSLEITIPIYAWLTKAYPSHQNALHPILYRSRKRERMKRVICADKAMHCSPCQPIGAANATNTTKHTLKSVPGTDALNPTAHTLKENFDAARGDLIYGLSSSRQEILRMICRDDPYIVLGDTCQYLSYLPTVDAIANAKCLASYDPKHQDECDKGMVRCFRGAKLHVNPSIRAIHSSWHANAADRYARWFSDSQNFNAYQAVFEAVHRVEKVKPKYSFSKSIMMPTKTGGGYDGGEKLAIKRICKAGLLSAALPGTVHHIHFDLTEINEAIVVNKLREASGISSFTSSELRLTYRKKDEIGDRVHFYKGEVEVRAPWIDNPEVWEKYSPKGASQELAPPCRSRQRFFCCGI